MVVSASTIPHSFALVKFNLDRLRGRSYNRVNGNAQRIPLKYEDGAQPEAGLKTATMKDVALLAGVSIGTVDRVFHNRGRFSKNTAERVWEAAKSLRFQPNRVASNLSRAEHHTFLALLPHPDQDGGFWKLVVAGITRAVKELAHHYVNVRFAHYDRFDPPSFDRAVEEVFVESGAGAARERRVRGMVLAPTLQREVSRLLADHGEIPTVVLDGELPDGTVLCSISQESFESGLLAAKMLHLLARTGRVASVTVGQGDYHLNRRRAGFEAYFAGSLEKTAVAGNERRAIDVERIEAHDERHLYEVVRRRGAADAPPLAGIFVTNAAAHAVVAALRPMHIPPIVGYDLISENITCLRDGELSFLINQQPGNQGYQAVYALYRHAVLGETIEPQHRIPVDLVSQETLRFHHSAASAGDMFTQGDGHYGGNPVR